MKGENRLKILEVLENSGEALEELFLFLRCLTALLFAEGNID